MSRVVSLPERLIGAVIHGCWDCPFYDGSSPQNEHCNIIHHFGIERVTAVEDGFEVGCPLEEAPDGKHDTQLATDEL